MKLTIAMCQDLLQKAQRAVKDEKWTERNLDSKINKMVDFLTPKQIKK